jgi:hypothetical protein
VLRATGWRISDVLLLRMEQCLEQTEKGWWICGDISIMWNTLTLIFYRLLRTFSRGITIFDFCFSSSN